MNAVSGGTFELAGGTINGGTIAALGLTSSGTVNNATFTGTVSLPASSGVTFGIGTTFAPGTTATFGINTSGITIAAGAAFTLGATSTATGDLQISSSAAGASFVNQGTLTHNVATPGQINAPTVTNEGTINVSGLAFNTFTLGSTGQSFTNAPTGIITSTGANNYVNLVGLDNQGTLIASASGELRFNGTTGNAATGTITTNGGNISLIGGGAFTNSGTINVQTGTFDSGTNFHNDVGGLIKGSGTINGDLFMDGGTIGPGNSIGTLTLTNSDFTVTAPSVFEVELSGTASDQLVFVNPTSVVNLGSGLLSLSLILLGPPTPNTTYNIISISSGGSGISGTFVGLPTSGSTLSAFYLATPYTFSVTYLANSVTLFAAVPEPSSYALMGTGLALLAFGRWRRRRG